jgi:hypothetical protein
MAACEASALKAGVSVVEVGFGQSSAQSGPNDGFGNKRLIAAKLDSVSSRGQLNVTTGNQSGEYYGDSGGPVFFQMPDKTWRFIGDDCCAPDIVDGSPQPRVSTYIAAPPNLGWLESSSAVDLTLCHDGDRWSPGALCNALPTTPEKASGGWAAACSAQNQLAPQPTCNTSGGAGGASSGGASGGGASAGGSSGAGGGGTTGTAGGGGANGGMGGGHAEAGGASGTGAGGAAGGSGVGGGSGASIGGALGQGGTGGSGGLVSQAGTSAASGANSHSPPDPSGCACALPVSRPGAPWHSISTALALALARRRLRARGAGQLAKRLATAIGRLRAAHSAATHTE